MFVYYIINKPILIILFSLTFDYKGVLNMFEMVRNNNWNKHVLNN
jgi:uncharacterized protein YciU (UPF0263 family)